MATNPAPARPQRGFTLIELLVVVSIIAILAALSMAGVNMILQSMRRASTQAMMSDLTLAIREYLNEYAVLGDSRDENALDFTRRPMRYLIARPLTATPPKDPFLRPKLAQVAKGQDLYEPCPLTEAEVYLDDFRQPFLFEIWNGSDGGSFNYTKTIRIISRMGTERTDDDLVMTWGPYCPTHRQPHLPSEHQNGNAPANGGSLRNNGGDWSFQRGR
jgi:prepilin-type N-terminal cleavage/methylation domain-containing protein